MKRTIFNRIGRLRSKTLFAASLLIGIAGAEAADPVSTAPTVATKPKSRSNIVYHPGASGIAARADLRIPATDAPASGFPIVVVVHGGAWMTGDKWTMFGYSQALADRGIASLTINYRHAPEFKYPAQVDDVRQSLVWIQNHADDYSLDQNRVGMFGYSAGGHLALLLATLADENDTTQAAASQWAVDDDRWNRVPKIRAVCAGGPPCDFTRTPDNSQIMAYFLGGSKAEIPEIYRSASPIMHVSAGDPPVRLLHGESDTLVPITNSRSMKQSLEQRGVSCDLIAYPKRGHMTTFLAPQAPIDMAEFFVSRLKSGPMNSGQ